MDPVRYTDMIPGCYDPVERAKDLLTNGVRASVCFPTFPRFAGVTFLKSDDKELADLCVKAYNDWLIDEWCASVPGMYIPMIIGQLWDPRADGRRDPALRRPAAHVPLTFPENPVPLGLPSFSTDHWDPVWEAVRRDRHRGVHAHRHERCRADGVDRLAVHPGHRARRRRRRGSRAST